MYQSTYFIEKSTNTFADNLAAFGLAFVINTIADGRAKVRMEDKGYAFAVICEPAVRQEWIEKRKFFVGAPLLITVDTAATKKHEKITKAIKGTKLDLARLPEPDGYSLLDYQTEKKNKDDFFTWVKALSPEDKKRWHAGEIQPPSSLHQNWEIFRAVNPGALQSYNAPLGIWWQAQTVFPDLLKILLGMVANVPNDVDGAETAWNALCKENGLEKTKDVTANQLINPSQGKGVNSPKTEWRDPNNVKGFWLLEWLKTVGLFYGSYTRIVANPKDPRNAKDRKTYVLSPSRLGWIVHQKVMKHFRQAMSVSQTAIKMDVLVSLQYTQSFLKHYEDARVDDLGEDIFGEPPADLVSGMQMAFYKNLGNSPAVMNIASVNLPRWIAPHNPEQLTQFQASLDEHISIVRNLDETHGEQFALLSNYRDFVSGDQVDAFFEFTNAYSGFVISQLERRKFVRPFSIPTLEVLFMNSEDDKYSEIMQNEGFRNIAYAIRHSTVSLQNAKKFRKPATDIRYGLGQQLARKAAYPEDFLAELGEFLHLYNAENAQLREKGRNPFRSNVRMEDMEEIVKLVDRFGSKVVCNMLVAFGYASETRSKDKSESVEQEIDDAQADEEESGDEE
ncbi:MAG: hypothetical protein JXB85_03345 [Anaerolineales bacterium]|nr:hypothetical protein [Anaerolineales bacterium]